MIKKTFLVVSLIMVMATIVLASADDGVAVRSSVDRKTITIGDRVKYKIAIDCPKDFEIKPLEFKDDKIGEFEIKDSGSKSAVSWYYITAYSTGDLTIPAVDIRYRQIGKADWLVKHTDPVKIKVASVLPKDGRVTDIKDIKGPLYFREIPWGLISFIILIIAAIIFAVLLYRKMMKKALFKLPHEIALRELEVIRKQYSNNSDVKEYYAGISDTVRRYIEYSFKLKAPEMTTEEFLGSIKESGNLAGNHKGLLGLFLTACDLVKFAKYNPKRDEIDGVFVTAKNFIEETRPKEEAGSIKGQGSRVKGTI